MAWVREKNPKRKARVPERDPKEALEGFLSYLACKPGPNAKIEHYLHEELRKRKPEVVPREPTVYDEDEQEEDENDYEPAPLQNQRQRNQHHHSHENLQPTRTPAPRYVSNIEPRPYRPRTNVQTRRVVSSWSNATTPLAI